jgi:hypothetical protein
MADFQTIAESYIRLWNETDSAHRDRLLAEGWALEATYIDPLASVTGHEQINSLIGSVQKRFPDFKFTLTRAPDGHGDHLRFGWSLGPAGAEPPIQGSDVVTLRNGRIASVIGFLDRVPT